MESEDRPMMGVQIQHGVPGIVAWIGFAQLPEKPPLFPDPKGSTRRWLCVFG